ncbi:MAG: response regulator [Beijerinckiaceae bacterium]|nr:response regulator [Beijerinckiaceae bacterium]
MSAEATPRKLRILIVEDEPFIALALESALRELGFDVVDTVARISSALAAIGREEIDGASLDVNLGSQRIDPVADALASSGRPFFFMTGYGVSDVPAAHAGRCVLQKPFRLEQLMAALHAEFGFPLDGVPGFERGASGARGEHHLVDRRRTPAPAPSP